MLRLGKERPATWVSEGRNIPYFRVEVRLDLPMDISEDEVEKAFYGQIKGIFDVSQRPKHVCDRIMRRKNGQECANVLYTRDFEHGYWIAEMFLKERLNVAEWNRVVK